MDVFVMVAVVVLAAVVVVVKIKYSTQICIIETFSLNHFCSSPVD